MWKFILSNKSGKPVEVNTDLGEDTGLVVATRPHKTFYPVTKFFTNETYGREMAQDAAFGAGELLLHNGTDNVAWTMSNEVGGKWDDNSTDRPYAGTKSLKCDNPAIGDIMQLINNVGPGTDVDMGGYIALTMWINVDKDWLAGDSITLYAYVGGVLVGNSVALEDYFDYDTYDIYQYVNIPLTDLGIEASLVDAFRIENAAREGGKSPKFYIDNMYLQTSGVPIIYTVEPDKGTWLHVNAFKTIFADALITIDADATLPNLSFDQILGMSPTAGYIYKRYAEGKDDPEDEERITSLLDLLSFPQSKLVDAMSDKSNTMISIHQEYNVPLVLKSEDLDKITFTIEDDFSLLLFFRISLNGFVEYR